jgi:hypothetical protein
MFKNPLSLSIGGVTVAKVRRSPVADLPPAFLACADELIE